MASQLSLLAALLAAWAAAGCGARPTSRGPAPPPADTASAEDVLQRMVEQYRIARSYRDRGLVRLRYRQDGQRFEDTAELAVKLQRPRRLYAAIYQVKLACDGEKIRARIVDEQTDDLDHQFVVRPAPETLSLTELYTDGVLNDAMTSGLGRHPPQLEMLLGNAPLAGFLADDAAKRLLSDGTIQQRACYRVEVTVGEGKYVLWIDRETYLLRKLEYPIEEIKAHLEQSGAVEDLELVAEFRDAAFDAQLSDDDFFLAMPDDARQVEYFVTPPQPLPTALFGKQPEKFVFTALDGSRVSSNALAGKVAVLVWFNNHPACRVCLEQLNQVYVAFGQQHPLTFHVVCTEPSSVSNSAVEQLMSEWGVTVPVARDLEAHGRDGFHIPWAPTLVVLDAAGKVQIFEVGANPQLAEQLPIVLQRLLAGEDLAAEILAQHQREREQYERLVAEGGTLPNADATAPTARLREKSAPKYFELEPLWESHDISNAGNVLVVERRDSSSWLVVCDGKQDIVELDSQGQLLARRRLDLPADGEISCLRTASDGQGRRYVAGWSVPGRQVHLFDEQWHRVLSYPDPQQSHDGIVDVQLADLNADGELELLLGFWGIVGVQSVSLNGQRNWPYRSIANVFSLAVTPPNEVGWHKLLVTGDQGRIHRLNQFGKPDPESSVANWGIHHLYSAEFPGGKTTYCGFSYTPQGNLVAVGLDSNFNEQWNFALPAGTFDPQFRFATSARLTQDSAGQWVIAGPDGSIQIVSHDGELFDSFGYGEFLRGMAVTNFGQNPVLLLATQSGVAAWHLKAKARGN